MKYDITETPNPWKRILGLEKICQICLVAAIIGLIRFWRPHTTWAPKKVGKEGKFFISGKSSLLKYHNLARNGCLFWHHSSQTLCDNVIKDER